MQKILAIAMTLCLLMLPMGCDVKESLDGVATAAQSQGREYGQTYELKQDESMKTAFFDCKVNSATISEDFGEYLPSVEDHKFLVVNVTIDNTFADDASIPMTYNDFMLGWEGLGDDIIEPEQHFADDMLPNEYEIFKGESQTGNLVFEVPADKTEFDFEYYELWDDDFEGNTYTVHVVPEVAAPAQA